MAEGDLMRELALFIDSQSAEETGSIQHQQRILSSNLGLIFLQAGTELTLEERVKEIGKILSQEYTGAHQEFKKDYENMKRRFIGVKELAQFMGAKEVSYNR